MAYKGFPSFCCLCGESRTLWKAPVYCAAASWIIFYLTIYLGRFFFTVETVGADGTAQLSVDPVRYVVFDAALSLIVLLIGGLVVFRSMSKAEIGISAGIAAGIYLLIVLVQLYIPSFPISLSVSLAHFQTWTGTAASFFMKLTDNFTISVQTVDKVGARINPSTTFLHIAILLPKILKSQRILVF